jgi:ABC-2 type transport system ATP-binding protein
LDAGRALAVVGENGAGKTTLLKILATASKPDSGTLTIGGIDALQNAAAVRERLGYVPQGIALMQELSVKDNLYYWMKTKDKAVYETVMDIIGLKDAEKKKVARLSGGMKRRLNIGASLVLRPSLLILDEPLAGVDIANRQKIMASLSALKSSGMTIIFTSHYIDEMQMLADEMIALREGTVTYSGPMDFENLADVIRRYTA